MDTSSARAADPGSELSAQPGQLIYRQSGWTRLTHWVWAISLFFLLLTGLQIFNAHPTLYLGDQSGFGFDNEVLAMRGENTPEGPVGYVRIFGVRFDTTGVFGVVHFFFAWILSGTLLVWLAASFLNGHLKRDLAPRAADLRQLPRDIVEHAKLRFHHRRNYNTLQKFTYGVVLFILLPLMILTGLAMSPTMNAALPFLADLLGGRQTARTIHFLVMLLLVAFFVIHILMIVAAGPINELRSIITGWYRTDPEPGAEPRT
jgi:thiosulfate reductase cytochrome b subunit